MARQAIISFSMKEKVFTDNELKRFLKISFYFRKLRLEIIFHLYILVLVVCLFIFFVKIPDWLRWTNITIVFTALWIQLAQAFIIRFNIGLADRYPRAYTLSFKWKNLGTKLPNVSKKNVTLQTIAFVMGLTLTTILGYSAIYFEISRLLPDSFQNSNLSLVDSVYFSIISFTAGDISPKQDFSKIIAASEIIYSLATLAVLVLSFSLTHADEST